MAGAPFSTRPVRAEPGATSVKQISSRELMVYYLSALTIIASLSVASHLVLERVLQSNEGSAAIINVSGRQRMLSQRIASLAAQYRLGDPTARPALLATLAEFETQNLNLVDRERATELKANTPSPLHALYFGGPRPLDAAVRQFVADARAVAALPANDKAMAQPLADLFAAARDPLLTSLDSVVTIHQQNSERTLAELEHIQWAILLIVLTTLALEALAIFRPMVNKIIAFTHEIMRLAATDPLTGLANRRQFMERAQAAMDQAIRDGQPLSLLMLDADRFKSINDTHGHGAGDDVLKAMAETLARQLRPADLLARIGGEEFAVLLPHTALSTAAERAERLRRAVADLRVPHNAGLIALTASVGAAVVPTTLFGIDEALKSADAALLDAKRSGRDRVVIAASPPDHPQLAMA